MAATPLHLFERDGDRFVPTGATRGPWDPNSMHGGPVSALCARAAERHDQPGAERADGQLLARLTVDLVRPAPLVPLSVRTSTIRPGRKVQLVAVEVEAAGQVVTRATALRMRTAALELPVPAQDPSPPFALDAPRVVRRPGDELHFHSHGLDLRRLETQVDAVPGEPAAGTRPATVWARLACLVVAGEEVSPHQRAAAFADMGSGMSSIVPFDGWTYVNADVDLHLHRPPRGEWLSLTCATQAADLGVGVASSTMSDREGRCGQVVQAVLLERRSTTTA